MILHWTTEGGVEEARDYEILDAATGEPLPTDLPIFYADDERGILRYYRLDEAGELYWVYATDPGVRVPEGAMWRRSDDSGQDVSPRVILAWEEVRRPIRITRKSA